MVFIVFAFDLRVQGGVRKCLGSDDMSDFLPPRKIFYAPMGRSANLESCLLWCVPLSQQERAVLKKLGASVRRVRTGKGMTQESLAELSDLHLRSLQKIEAGEKNVLITTVKRIQHALGCQWDDLMG